MTLLLIKKGGAALRPGDFDEWLHILSAPYLSTSSCSYHESQMEQILSSSFNLG